MLIPEIFRHRRGRVRGLETLHRRAVGCGDDQHGLFPPFRAKIVLNELTHFAAALADQRQHAHIGGTAFDDAGQERTFTAASRRENAHALALAAGKHPVEHAQAQRNRPVDDLAEHGVRRIGVNRIVGPGLERRPAVDGIAEPVQDAPEEIFAHGHGMDFPRRDDFGCGRNALQIAERRQQGHLLHEAHDLGPERPVLPRVAQDAQFADLHPRHHGPDDGPHDLLHAAPHLHRGGRLHRFLKKRSDIFKGHRASIRLSNHIRDIQAGVRPIAPPQGPKMRAWPQNVLSQAVPCNGTHRSIMGETCIPMNRAAIAYGADG